MIIDQPDIKRRVQYIPLTCNVQEEILNNILAETSFISCMHKCIDLLIKTTK